MLNRLFNRIKKEYYKSSSERYIKYLRSIGVKIGTGTCLRPQTTNIDITRPSLVTIGDNVYINENFTLLTHDWVTQVFINSEREFLPSSGRVSIGNNVSFGQNVTVLKGVTIGDNVFIGAGSIVTKDIPSNSIAAGLPCKVICSLEDYYLKRQTLCVNEALEYAKSISERFGRKPQLNDFWEEFPLFISGNQIEDYPELKSIIQKQCGPSYERYVKEHKAIYRDFDEFLFEAGYQNKL